MLTILKYVFALVPDFIRPQWVCLNSVIWYGEWSLCIILEFVRVDILKPSGQLYSIFWDSCPYAAFAAKVEAFGRAARTQKDSSTSSGWLESAERPLSWALRQVIVNCTCGFLQETRTWCCWEQKGGPVFKERVGLESDLWRLFVSRLPLSCKLFSQNPCRTSERATYMLTMWATVTFSFAEILPFQCKDSPPNMQMWHCFAGVPLLHPGLCAAKPPH